MTTQPVEIKRTYCRICTAKFSPLTIDGTAKTMVAGELGGFPGLNALTSTNDVDRLGGMAWYSGVPIEIEPLNES